jgi:hypothetical protein
MTRLVSLALLARVTRLAITLIAAVTCAASIVVTAITPAPGVNLTASALYMGGTGHPLDVPGSTTDYIASYIGSAYQKHVGPSGLCSGGNPGCAQVAVYTPEQFEFDTGLFDMTFDASVQAGLENVNACVRGQSCVLTLPPYTTTDQAGQLSDTAYVVYGYSQSATIVSYLKDDMIAHPLPSGSTVNFVLTGNPNRPNGGLLERLVGIYIPVVGVTFNGAMATNSPEPNPLTTVDFARQYDLFADFPAHPLNLLADVNALLGFVVHARTFNGDPQLQGQYQDTTYYFSPTPTLPLVAPIYLLPVVGPTLAALLDPPLRVLVEAAYERTINPGQPTPARFLHVPDVSKLLKDFVVAIPTGWDDAIAVATNDPANRPFRTAPPGVFGVGGPPVYVGAIDPYGPPTPYTPLAGLPARATDSTFRASQNPAAARATRRLAQRASGSSKSAARQSMEAAPVRMQSPKSRPTATLDRGDHGLAGGLRRETPTGGAASPRP